MPPATRATVRVVDGTAQRTRDDFLATEEPLEIRVAASHGDTRTVGITMRTPGSDFELAAGFLLTEGVLEDRSAIVRIDYCLNSVGHGGENDRRGEQHHNVVRVHLAGGRLPELSSLDRYGTMSSACGVCGKASLEALEMRGVRPLTPDDPPRIALDVLYSLPDALRAAQSTFTTTGGLHAAGLFTASGETLAVREDIGRHNAVDKVIGWALLKDRLAEARQAALMVSGRAGFEIVQKAAAAAIPVVCAVSAPSSLAVATAERFGLTLVGFLRGRRANVYAGARRFS